MRFSLFLVLSSFLSLLSKNLAEQCGEQAGGKLCPNGLCCSKWGFCGCTPDYCGNGCQSQCDCASTGGLTQEQCGKQAGGKLCPNGLCCSKWGFCGCTPDYCGNGCQSQCDCASTRGLTQEQCGKQADGKVCPNDLCCSKWGFCGSTPPYCCEGCQSQCNCSKLSRLLPESTFDELLLHRNDPSCPAKGFYTYEAFIEAAKSFPDFVNSDDDATNKREIAAFLAHSSHSTRGGWPDAPNGTYAWGFCYIADLLPKTTYYQRYVINKQSLRSQDALVSFKSAFSFWMTAQSPKPSCHDVIIGNWKPSKDDILANWLPGFGLTTNIINGKLECGEGFDERGENRIGFYKRFCDILGTEYGDNLDCYDQLPFGSGLSSVVDM